jgi:hypothetical protein
MLPLHPSMKFEFSEHTTAYLIAKRNLTEQVAQPTGKTEKTNLGLEAKELATLLEKALVGDFDTTKVSRAAYEVYHQYGLDLTPEMDRIILTLMPRNSGKVESSALFGSLVGRIAR